MSNLYVDGLIKHIRKNSMHRGWKHYTLDDVIFMIEQYARMYPAESMDVYGIELLRLEMNTLFSELRRNVEEYKECA